MFKHFIYYLDKLMTLGLCSLHLPLFTFNAIKLFIFEMKWNFAPNVSENWCLLFDGGIQINFKMWILCINKLYFVSTLLHSGLHFMKEKTVDCLSVHVDFFNVSNHVHCDWIMSFQLKIGNVAWNDILYWRTSNIFSIDIITYAHTKYVS